MPCLRAYVLPLALCLASALGCSTDTPDDDAPPTSPCTGEQAGDTPIEMALPVTLPELAIGWSDCPLHELSSQAGTASCADVLVPLRYGDEGESFSVRVKRWQSDPAEPGEAQLWLVSGGPGASATVLFPALMQALGSVASLDIYTLDQRGTGYSERLSCPEQEHPESELGPRIANAEIAACAQAISDAYGARSSAYAATFSAADLGALIEATRQPDVPVYVWGGSYGSYVVQRFLQLFPNHVDGIILEAINAADRSTLDFAEGIDFALQRILAERCSADATCSSKLGSAPYATYFDAMAQYADGSHCTELSGQLLLDDLRRLFMGAAQSPQMHFLVPPMAYRLARCEPGDVQVLLDLNNLLTSNPTPSDTQWSWPLYNQIVLSEFIFNGQYPDIEQAQALADTQATQPHLIQTAATQLERHAAWQSPRYCDPSYDNQWADIDTPMLMLQGALDPLTSAQPHAAAAVGAHFNGPNQHYIEFPHATHGVTFYTRYGSGNSDCALQMYLAFMADPTAAPDTACVAETFPIDFDPPAATLTSVGLTDLWENG